mmetsp:Transcript_78429/g.190029  ORF Transcript_78429/g.190029 Transcript_78429/m.190029 type:complete len:804 (+) Transcript_78429:1311-3722(+)
MSESSPVCSADPRWRLETPDAVGRPIGPSVRVVSKDGEPLPYGQVGEVQIRGPGVMSGYLRETGEPVGKEFLDGWLFTGDRGMLDRTGLLALHGRIKEVAKRGGEQVSLFEVDDAVRTSPDVEIAVSFIVPNELWGEEVQVAVVPTAAAAGDIEVDANGVRRRILNSARAMLIHDYKVPAHVVFVTPEQLPVGRSGKYKRFLFAETLNAVAMDTAAMEAVVGGAGGAAAGTKFEDVGDFDRSFKPSKSLYGLRFLMGLWVVQLHVSYMPTFAWAKLRSYSLNMPGFIIIAGLQLAASATHTIKAEDRREYFISRFAATWPVFLLSFVVSVVAYTTWCFPGAENESCPSETGAWMALFAANCVLYLSGVGGGTSLNGPAWYQSAFYFLTICFPAADGMCRGCSQRTRLGFILGSHVLMTVTYLIVTEEFVGTLNLNVYGYFHLFCFGVGLWHMMRDEHERLRNIGDEAVHRNTRMWGYITDALSAVFLGVALMVMIEDCNHYGINPERGYEAGDANQAIGATGDLAADLGCAEDWESWTAIRESGFGRWTSTIGQLFGWRRLGVTFLLPWIYGLGVGGGWTAKLFSNNFVTKHLAPLIYPLYLLHLPIAVILYTLAEGTTYSSIGWFGAIPVKADYWLFWATVVISMSAGWLYNEFVTPRLMPCATCWWRFWFNNCCCCKPCCVCCSVNCPAPAPVLITAPGAAPGDQQVSLQDQVANAIRSLTGAEVVAASPLDSIGLDSFGATALVGKLRSASVPGARDLGPVDVVRMATVRDLVAHLHMSTHHNAGRAAAALRGALGHDEP